MAGKKPEPEALEALLRKRVAQAEEETLRDGSVSKESMDELNRVAGLIELREKTRPSKVSHLFVAVLLAATLAISSILLFTHVHVTQIDLDATVSEAGFTVTANHLLSDAIPLETLGVSGVHNIEVPLGMAAVQGSFFRLSAFSQGARHGEVTLALLQVRAGTRVWLTSSDGRLCRISLSGNTFEVHAAAAGNVRMDPPGLTEELASPKDFAFSGGPASADFELLLTGGGKQTFAGHLPVSELDLWHVEESHGDNNTLVDRISTIAGGSLYLSALGDQEYKLRAGQPLELIGLRGVIRKLAVSDGQISLQFEGEVHGLHEGIAEGFRNLMPTYLEWARARHGLALLWGSAIYLFGLAMAVLRWFDIVK